MVAVSNIHNCPAWVTLTTYTVGQRVSNDTAPVKAYQCTTGGLSGATGPTGTGGSISDGFAVWKYLSAVDYTSLASWWAALPATLTQPVEADVWNDAEYASSSAISLSGVTSSGTNTVLITAAPGESFADNAGKLTNGLRYNALNGAAFSCSGAYTTTLSIATGFVTVSRLQFRQSSSGGNNNIALNFASGISNVTLSQLIVQCALLGNSARAISCTGSAVWTLSNVLAVLENSGNSSTSAFGIFLSCSGASTVEECTVVMPSNTTAGTSTGIDVSYSNVTVRNCAIFGFGTALGGSATFGADGHNVTNLSSMGKTSTSNLVSQAYTTATFAQPSSAGGAFGPSGTMDFRLVTGSALIDAGSSSVSPAFDIVGTTRPQGSAYDVGAWEFSASGTAITVHGGGCASFESLSRADVAAASENLSNAVRDAGGPVGFSGSATSHVGGQTEDAALSRFDGPSQAEILLSVLTDRVAQVEDAASVRVDRAAPVEWSGQMQFQADTGGPLEWLGLSRADAAGSAEWVYRLVADRGSPTEDLGSTAILTVSAIEGSASVRSDSKAVLDGLASILADRGVPVEWTGSQQFVVSAGSGAALEWSSGLSLDGSAPVEFSGEDTPVDPPIVVAPFPPRPINRRPSGRGGLNLHSIASGVIAAVNPPVVVTLRQGIGFTTNADFSRTPTYRSSTMRAQIQGMQSDDIRLLNGLGIQGVRRKIYLWGSLSGLVRGLHKGNDIVVFPDGSEWKCVYVLEDYGHGVTGRSGWCSIVVTLQNPTSEG